MKSLAYSPTIFTLTGPSGVGKDTLLKKALAQNDLPITLAQAYTTRRKRPGEKDGKPYHFVHRYAFYWLQKFSILAPELTYRYNGNQYGVAKATLKSAIRNHKPILLADVLQSGVEWLKKTYTHQVFSIFIAPPPLNVITAQLATLKERLIARYNLTPLLAEQDQASLTPKQATSLQEIRNRQALSKEALEAFYQAPNTFDCIIVNDQVEPASQQLKTVLKQSLNLQPRDDLVSAS
jgi:guanylate kinase